MTSSRSLTDLAPEFRPGDIVMVNENLGSRVCLLNGMEKFVGWMGRIKTVDRSIFGRHHYYTVFSQWPFL